MQLRTVRAATAFIAAVCVSSFSFAQEMPRGSFLLSPVQSRYQLVQQVQVDPEVSLRYQRHFGMTDQEVVHYFSTLRTTTLTEPRTYTVWYTRPGSQTYYSKSLRLKKGEPVFVDQTNRVVLRLKCGNPMITKTVARDYYTTYVQPTVMETTTVTEQRAQPIVEQRSETIVQERTETSVQQRVQPVVEQTTISREETRPTTIITRVDLDHTVQSSFAWEDQAATYVLAEAMDMTPEALIALRPSSLSSVSYIELAPAIMMSWHAKQPVETIWTDYSNGTTWVDLAGRYSLPTTYWNASSVSTTGWTNQEFSNHFWRSLATSNLSVPNTDFTYFESQKIPMNQWLVASVIGRRFNVPAQHALAVYRAANNNWDAAVAHLATATIIK